MTTEEELLKAFRMIDKKGAGVITADELREYLYKRQHNELFVQKYLRLFDRNRDGKITLDEYQKTLNEIPRAQRQAIVFRYSQWRHLFEKIDKDGNGFITKQELLQAIQEMGAGSMFGAADVDKFFANSDKDYDGRINYREFLEWMNQSQDE
uniref:Calmodulin n=1 Tax=Macrostomum lignano TaxID=282301 RepID=A0A1I8GQN3_9PLAT